MFKNWNTTKTLVTIGVLLLVVGFFAGWFGETFSYKGLTTRSSNAIAKGKRKTECIGGFVSYQGNASNVPCDPKTYVG